MSFNSESEPCPLEKIRFFLIHFHLPLMEFHYHDNRQPDDKESRHFIYLKKKEPIEQKKDAFIS